MFKLGDAAFVEPRSRMVPPPLFAPVAVLDAPEAEDVWEDCVFDEWLLVGNARLLGAPVGETVVWITTTVDDVETLSDGLGIVLDAFEYVEVEVSNVDDTTILDCCWLSALVLGDAAEP